ncbi:flagellar assembly protein FliW [Cohnella sp. LGH]|uniref:flagellar assembly protein FliW n=1 Tax=Cohnella sp. LGH TaxID=1619153 RepID=UPI001AD98430|nr:flagellar assembly protein FliW [Cohnella sp. LGH]QTH42293.1 flagellar assembly protein FliW [Cohnella sp. LGH]
MSAEAKTDNVESLRIHFKEGLPGFEAYKAFNLFENESNKPFGTLQSTDQETISFVVVDPFLFFKDYEFDLAETSCQELQIRQAEDLLIRSIVSIRGEAGEASVNLVAPIVVNRTNREGRQVILTNTRYSTRHRLFEPSEGR